MLCPKTSSSDQKKSLSSLTSQLTHSSTGIRQENSLPLELRETTVDTDTLTSTHCSQNNPNQKNKESVTAESHPTGKRKIWNDKLSSSEINILTTQLLRTLDQALTSKEKVLTPFWTPQSKEISKKLWLPTKTDCVDSVLTSSNESSPNAPMGKSWFSIKNKHPLKKSSLATSFQSSQFSLPASMVSEVTSSNKKSKPLKTLKLRMFPTKEEKKELDLMMEQYRWYYNTILTVVYTHFGHENILDKRKYSNYTVRDLLRKYEYVEKEEGNLIFKEYVYDEDRDEVPVPEWWEGKVHNRIPRGAVNKFVSSLNSAISNYKNGNISKFQMNFRSKKNPTDYLNFEDKAFPSFIRKIKSRYWFTTRNKKRVNISLEDIDAQKRGLEIIYEKETGKYFLHYPVERDWFPDEDRRNDSQVRFSSLGDRIISLDPGVRKFMVGYDPTGKSIFIGEGANTELTQLLHAIDKSEKPYLLWKKVKNMVSELHWKTISFLVENYDTIILPDFRVSEMVRKRKLARITKRLMCMFSFHSFREKLQFKCNQYGKKLIIVDESFTSCTCGKCGVINDTKGKEVFECGSCGLVMDRDGNGSRNILIKNVTLR